MSALFETVAAACRPPRSVDVERRRVTILIEDNSGQLGRHEFETVTPEDCAWDLDRFLDRFLDDGRMLGAGAVIRIVDLGVAP